MRTRIRGSSVSTRSSDIIAKRTRRVTLFEMLKQRESDSAVEYVPLRFCHHYLEQLRDGDNGDQLKLVLEDDRDQPVLSLSLGYLKILKCDLTYLKKMYRFDLEEFERIGRESQGQDRRPTRPRLIFKP
jgi:hypothetical protein